MHEHGSSITGLAIVVLAALACGIVMLRMRQPVVLGYIVAGAVLGPSGLGLVENRANVQLLAELGVLMLLFLIGMELSLRSIREVWKIALLVTVLQILIGVGTMYALGFLLDASLPIRIILGFVVALSSTAVAIKMLEDIGEKKTRVGQITIGILIAQDLAVVPMMLVVASFADEGGLGPAVLIKIALSIALLGGLIVFLGRRKRFELPFAKLIGRNVDLTPLAGMALCFGAAAVSGLLEMSAAYGAFLAGLVIGNSTGERIMLRQLAPIQSILLMIFFLSIGLLLDFEFIWENLGAVVVIVLFVTLFKTALNIGFIRLMGESWPNAFLAGVLLAQLGEFSFLLAALGLQTGVLDDVGHRLLVAVTVLSLMFSPLWLETARRAHRIALLGITSGRETMRLTFGGEVKSVVRGARRARLAMLRRWIWVNDRLPSLLRRDRSGSA